MESKKYTVDYCSAATGYGWRQDYDRLDEFEDFVNESRRDAMAYISVWDNTLHEFVFDKGYGFTPRIDKLKNPRRDMRTATREAKR